MKFVENELAHLQSTAPARHSLAAPIMARVAAQNAERMAAAASSVVCALTQLHVGRGWLRRRRQTCMGDLCIQKGGRC